VYFKNKLLNYLFKDPSDDFAPIKTSTQHFVDISNIAAFEEVQSNRCEEIQAIIEEVLVEANAEVEAIQDVPSVEDQIASICEPNDPQPVSNPNDPQPMSNSDDHPIILENIQIKQEFSPVIPPHSNHYDSEVMCMGTFHEDAIVIEDSDEEIISMLENNDAEKKDKFRLRLDQESESLSENTPPQISESRSEFELHLNQFKAADQQKALREKNNQRKRKATAKDENAEKFQFIDSSSQDELGN
jgi:hypothetical protein